MNRRARVDLRGDQSGLTLVEVIVAMMVFSIVAVGVAYTLTNILTLNMDARSRVVAANIAAEEIDKARSMEDVFKVVGTGHGDGNAPDDVPSSTVPVGGINYYVYLDARWVTDGDTTSQCGAAAATGNAALKYKRINVTVTWDGMRPGTALVRSDTVISPNSRINEPTLGSIVIAVEDELGSPQSGITSITTPTVQTGNAAAAVTAQGLETDADGCSYVLKVVPGTYDVKLTKTGYVDVYQSANTSSTAVATVTAGGTALASFIFDNGALITSTYPSGAMIPTNLQTTFSTTFADTVMSGANPQRVFPFGAGYQVIAGTVNDNGACKSPDPAAWPIRGDGAVATRPDPVTIAPGSAASVPVALGEVAVNTSSLKGKYITAVLQTTGSNGDPGCKTPTDSASLAFTAYKFAVLSNNPPATTLIGLPYGTYKLYYGNTAGTTTNALAGSPYKADGTPSGATATTTVTLDPRLVPVP